MKYAYTESDEKVLATVAAPEDALCPHCGGEVAKRRRKVMLNGEPVFFWRHKRNVNRHCPARKRPFAPIAML